LVQGSRPGYKGEKLSLNFQTVEVRSVLQVIADFTGLNIITSDTVTGNLTLRLKDIPWDQALDIILQTKGLDMRKKRYRGADRAAAGVRAQGKAGARIAAAEGRPRAAGHGDLPAQLREGQRPAEPDERGKTASGSTGGSNTFLTKRGSAFVDPRTNLLFVTDVASKLDEVRKVVRQIDVNVRQVMIETRIVIADDKFGRQLGVRFGQQTAFKVGNRYSSDPAARSIPLRW